MKRLVIVAGSLAATLVMCYAAFVLGTWGFDTRRFSQHQGRLERLLHKQPTLDLVVQALEDEGTPLVMAADGEESLRIAAETYGGKKKAEVLEKGRRWGRTRVFRAADMTYFIFFDRAAVMRDFTCVSR
jgi:hypothetical protein